LVVNWVSSGLSFFLSASTAATYIFTAPYCTTNIISFEPCALMLSISISHWDLLKYFHFMETTERGVRGWKEAQTQGEDRVILRITLLYFTLSLLSPHMLIVKHSPNAGTHSSTSAKKLTLSSTTRAQVVKRWDSSVLGCNNALPSKAFLGGTGPDGLIPSYIDGNKHVSIYLDENSWENYNGNVA
jgi:hypothetical protein